MSAANMFSSITFCAVVLLLPYLNLFRAKSKSREKRISEVFHSRKPSRSF
jgi:hypothetical protein